MQNCGYIYHVHSEISAVAPPVCCRLITKHVIKCKRESACCRGDDGGPRRVVLTVNPAVVRLYSSWFPRESVSCAPGGRAHWTSCWREDVPSEELTSGLGDGWRPVKHFLFQQPPLPHSDLLTVLFFSPLNTQRFSCGRKESLKLLLNASEIVLFSFGLMSFPLKLYVWTGLTVKLGSNSLESCKESGIIQSSKGIPSNLCGCKESCRNWWCGWCGRQINTSKWW